MNPNPLSPLNHFTVPVATSVTFLQNADQQRSAQPIVCAAGFHTVPVAGNCLVVGANVGMSSLPIDSDHHRTDGWNRRSPGRQFGAAICLSSRYQPKPPLGGQRYARIGRGQLRLPVRRSARTTTNVRGIRPCNTHQFRRHYPGPAPPQPAHRHDASRTEACSGTSGSITSRHESASHG
jgi:hypothetical protein